MKTNRKRMLLLLLSIMVMILNKSSSCQRQNIHQQENSHPESRPDDNPEGARKQQKGNLVFQQKSSRYRQ